jgi:peptide/nickel transport system permease protein
MLQFILRRLGIMALTMLCLTVIVFFMISLEPNLKKLAISQTSARHAEQLDSWLQRNGYRQGFWTRYGQWLGIVAKQPNIDPATGKTAPRFVFCDEPDAATYSGILQEISAARRSSAPRSRTSCFRRSGPPAS